MRQALSDAQAALVLGDDAGARSQVAAAKLDVERLLGTGGAREPSSRTAEQAAATGDEPSLAAARSTLWTAILAKAFREATSAAGRGDAQAARSWLLVREFRPPTRFSRASDDATVALDRLAAGVLSPRAAAADGAPRPPRHLRLPPPDGARRSPRSARARIRLEHAPSWERSRAGTGRSSSPRIAHSAGPRSQGTVELVRGDRRGGARRAPRRRLAAPRRAAPRGLPCRSSVRGRARPARRTARSLPAARPHRVRPRRLGRPRDARVRDPGGRDLPRRSRGRLPGPAPDADGRGRVAARALGARLDALEVALADASRGTAVAAPERVEATTDDALGLVSGLYPERGRRPRPRRTSTSSRRRSTASRAPPRQATGRARSPHASRRTASSSSGPSSGCAGSHRLSSRRSRGTSGTARAATTASSS